MKTIDVGYVIDEGRWTTYQKLLILGAALTIILDGVDNQLLGNAVPSLMKEWSLPRGAFSTILALSPFGMMIGGAVGGILGDRIGRRTALLFSMLSFAVLTLAISTVNGLMLLGAFRFLAGLGLGGAMPNAAALSSEYVPRRQRPFAVTLTIVCIPLGGTLAAFLSAWILPIYGWRTLFVLGGIIPIALAILLFKVLPESPRYLASRRERWPELIALLLMLILLGGTLNAVQTTMYALAANVYPTEIRGTGIGTAVAVGRIGNVLASYTGNFALDLAGPPAYFSSFSIGMVIVFISLSVIRRHIGSSVSEIAAARVGVPAGH